MAAPMVSRILRLGHRSILQHCKDIRPSVCLLIKAQQTKENVTPVFIRTQSILSLFDWYWKKKPVNLPYSVVMPADVSPKRTVPEHINKPSYAETGKAPPKAKEVDIKDEEAIAKLRKSCSLARKILDIAGQHVKVGVTTDYLDGIVHDACIEEDCYPSTLNYNGFPKSVCTSVNNILVHGIPDSRQLENGDIISIDVTIYHDGYHGDVSKTFLVGDVDEKGKSLVDTARRCRDEAIKVCKPGALLAEIGLKVQQVAQEAGLFASPSFMGHGIGTYFHGPPDILHYVNNFTEVMEPGMVFTIEPVVISDKTYPIVLDDKWTIISANDERGAQFEHTVLITDDGFEVLTKGKDEIW
ncbi:methionine aminopeptidase 1D, mitochondrial-like [Glandiceps talaboti]